MGYTPLTIPGPFLRYLKNKCVVDENDGTLKCKNCGETIHVDWFEKTLRCDGCDDV